MNNRIDWIDWAKAIAIFLMVVEHSWMAPDFVKVIVGAFHMPTFLIVSGYLYRQRDSAKSIFSFVIPWAFFSIVTIIYRFMFFENNSFLTYLQNVRFVGFSEHTGPGCFAGVWFLYALLGCRVLFGDVFKLEYIRANYKYITLVIIVILSIFLRFCSLGNMWYLLYTIPCLPFFAIGYYMKECNWVPSNINLLWGILCLVVFVSIILINGRTSIYGFNFGLTYILYFIGAIAGNIFLFKICSFLRPNDFVKMLSVGTLMILALHPWVFWSLVDIVPGRLYKYDYFIVPMMMMILFYPFIKIMNIYCPYLLGKIK